MSDQEHAEIVIVRRHGDHEEGHHGGAWKIAFADFMTALMALFLVLWLISSTNEDTKVSLARYFNPVKLVDMSLKKKGMADPSKADGGKEEAGKGATEAGEAEKNSGKKKAAPPPPAEAPAKSETHAAEKEKPSRPGVLKVDAAASTPGAVDPAREAALFRDPYAVLAGIAAADRTRQADAQAVDALGFGGSLPTEHAVDDDPFAAPAVPQPPAPASSAAPDVKPPSEGKARAATVGPGEGSGSRADEVTKLQTEIAKVVPAGTPSRPEPRIEVRSTGEGLLLSLTDDAVFSMFSVGSAEPQGQTVEVMARIAALLKTRPGTIVIRGFTDARPYKSPVYDNWRLSSARAHMAQYMLIRGGLDEKRVESVEGFADRRPKLPNDPLAPQNRRIEILIRPETAR